MHDPIGNSSSKSLSSSGDKDNRSRNSDDDGDDEEEVDELTSSSECSDIEWEKGRQGPPQRFSFGPIKKEMDFDYLRHSVPILLTFSLPH